MTRSQKRKAKSPAELLKNIDKFSSEDFKKAFDRLKRQRDTQEMIIEDAKRPAKIIGVGNEYVNQIATGIGNVKNATGNFVGAHDNFMLITKKGQKYQDQYSANFPGAKNVSGMTKDQVEDLLRQWGLI